MIVDPITISTNNMLIEECKAELEKKKKLLENIEACSRRNNISREKYYTSISNRRSRVSSVESLTTKAPAAEYYVNMMNEKLNGAKHQAVDQRVDAMTKSIAAEKAKVIDEIEDLERKLGRLREKARSYESMIKEVSVSEDK